MLPLQKPGLKRPKSSHPFGDPFYLKLAQLLNSQDPSSAEQLEQCCKEVDEYRAQHPDENLCDSGDEFSETSAIKGAVVRKGFAATQAERFKIMKLDAVPDKMSALKKDKKIKPGPSGSLGAGIQKSSSKSADLSEESDEERLMDKKCASCSLSTSSNGNSLLECGECKNCQNTTVLVIGATFSSYVYGEMPAHEPPVEATAQSSADSATDKTVPPHTQAIVNKYNFPKVELHLHLDGAVRFSTLWEMCLEKNLPVEGATDAETLQQILVTTKSGSLAGLLSAFSIIPPRIAGDVKVIERVAYELCEDQHNNGVIYFEARYSPHFMANYWTRN